MRRTGRLTPTPMRSRSDALVVREYFFAPGTPIPEIMAELGTMTPAELHDLAREIRGDALEELL